MVTRLHRTESFRLAAIVASVIVGAMLILMAPVYYIIQIAFRAELLNAVEQDVSAITTGYQTQGLPEAQEVIAQLLSNKHVRGFYVLERLPHQKLTGNLPEMPPKRGSFRIEIPQSAIKSLHGSNDHQILGTGTMITPELYLYAGRDSYVAIEAQEQVLRTFAWVLGATLLVALGGGILVSKSILGRMDAITYTCQAIMAGNLADRIPERGTRSEFDMLARTINEMLDRINALMLNVQQISNDIAHDLRTPLSRLRNRLELTLTEANTVKDYRQAVARTISECEMILTTFSSLLRIGQIEAATGSTPFSRVDLSSLLNELVDIYQPAAEDGGFRLVRDIQPGLFVLGEQPLLSQVFANLIENAMAHTPRGTTIEVMLARNNQTVVATVTDNGPGIPEEERERVLQRFYRCERSRSAPGSGLGLSLVSAISKYHSATLMIADNQPGLRVMLRFAVPDAPEGPTNIAEGRIEAA